MSQTEELSTGQRVFATVAGIALGIFASIWLLAGLILTWFLTGPPVDWKAVVLTAGLTLVVPVGLLVTWLVARADRKAGRLKSSRPSPAHAPPVEGAPETGRWVALPILGGVLLGLTVVACSLVAVWSPGLAATVLIVTLGLVVLVWLLGHLLTKQDDE